MTTRKKIKSNIVKKNFRKTRTINGGIFEPSSLTPLDVTNLNNKSIIKKWREKIKGSIIEDNNEKQTILNELFPHHSLIYKMDDISTMDDIILTKEEWKDKGSINDSKKYVYYLYNIEDCNIADKDFCEPIKLTPDDIASILNKNNQFSNYNRKKRPRELSPTTISVISPIASVKNIEQNTVFKKVIDLKGGIKRTKKSNKRFRKTRSKKQRGGVKEKQQEEKNLFLLNAVIHDLFDEVNYALEQGADVNTRYSPTGETPLMVASVYGYDEIVELLLDWGADVNLTSTIQNYTALIWASENGQFETVKILLDNGANVNAINDEGDTAIFLASLAGEFEIVKLLLERGATNVNTKNIHGDTAIEAAIRNNHTEVAKLLKKHIIAEIVPKHLEKQQAVKEEYLQNVENLDIVKHEVPFKMKVGQHRMPDDISHTIKKFFGGKRKTRKSKRKTKKSKKN